MAHASNKLIGGQATRGFGTLPILCPHSQYSTTTSSPARAALGWLPTEKRWPGINDADSAIGPIGGSRSLDSEIPTPGSTFWASRLQRMGGTEPDAYLPETVVGIGCMKRCTGSGSPTRRHPYMRVTASLSPTAISARPSGARLRQISRHLMSSRPAGLLSSANYGS